MCNRETKIHNPDEQIGEIQKLYEIPRAHMQVHWIMADRKGSHQMDPIKMATPRPH